MLVKIMLIEFHICAVGHKLITKDFDIVSPFHAVV